MLRFKILASAFPLLIAACSRRGGLSAGPRPCIAVGDTSVQISSAPLACRPSCLLHRRSRGRHRAGPAPDNAEAADFTVVDDVDSAESGACAANPATQSVAISDGPSGSAPVDLSVAGRPRRTTDLRAVADVFGARGRRFDRRRRRRSPERRRRVALTPL